MASIEPTEPQPVRNTSRDIVRGVSWAVLMRWSIRLLGLVSTIVLARLLSPQDFGIAAMGTLVIGFASRFTDVGTDMLLIRTKELDRAHCDTAWTINVLQSAILALLTLLLASPAADYFNEPRAMNVMYVLAFAVFLGGFRSIGPTLARRELKFSLDFRYNVYRRTIVFCATVSCAYILRDYWALVIGNLVGTIAGLALGYVMFPRRPRWCLERISEYLRFASSIMPMRLAFACYRQGPAFVVGGMGGATSLGAYTVSSGLSDMLTHEIVIPMGRGLFPNYARLADDPQKLSEVYRSVLGIVALMCIPLGIGLSAVAADLVAVVLGSQWAFVVPLVEYLAIGSALAAIGHSMTQQILVALGRERDAATLAWLRVAFLVPLLIIGVTSQGALGAAKALVVLPLLYIPVVFLATRHAVGLSPAAFIGLLWRPLLAATIMYLAVQALHLDGVEFAIVRLLFDVSVGAVVFIATLLGLWFAAGRPIGTEHTLLKLAAGRVSFIGAFLKK